MNYLILIIVAVLGVVIGAYFGRRGVKTFSPKSSDELDDMRVDAREALTERTENRKQKILELMKGEAIHQEELKRCNVADIKKGITCENVEKLLDVSDQTASKYLNELEKEQKIEQVGTSGRGVYYTLK